MVRKDLLARSQGFGFGEFPRSSGLGFRARVKGAFCSTNSILGYLKV